MKYVKGLIVTEESNILIEIPKDWRIQIKGQKFIMGKNLAGQEVAYNLDNITSIGEISESNWKNAITRLEQQREAAQRAVEEAGNVAKGK